MNEKSHQQASETREWSPVDALASAGRTLDRIGAQLQKEAHNIQQEAKRHAAEALAARVEATRQAESVWLALAKQMMAAVKQEQSRQDVLTAELTRARVQTLGQERPASGIGQGGTLGAIPTPSQGPSNAVDGAASPPRVAAFDVQRHPNGEIWMSLNGTVYNLGTYQASVISTVLGKHVAQWRHENYQEAERYDRVAQSSGATLGGRTP